MRVMNGDKILFNAEMTGKQLVLALNELCLEIKDLKDYIIEYELLGGEVKPLSPSDDRLSIL
jgi:hypothetical protein